MVTFATRPLLKLIEPPPATWVRFGVWVSRGKKGTLSELGLGGEASSHKVTRALQLAVARRSFGLGSCKTVGLA